MQIITNESRQALHTFEDFTAHSNYVELTLREQGYTNVFPHVGVATELTVRGKKIFPLVTGTFGGLDFVLSVIGEAGDHVASREVDEVNTALYDAVLQNKRGGPASLGGFTDAISRIPGTGSFISQARDLQAASDEQFELNRAAGDEAPDGVPTGAPAASPVPIGDGRYTKPPPGIPGMKLDPQTAIKKIYPILLFQQVSFFLYCQC
jgi:hypothetical protein